MEFDLLLRPSSAEDKTNPLSFLHYVQGGVIGLEFYQQPTRKRGTHGTLNMDFINLREKE